MRKAVKFFNSFLNIGMALTLATMAMLVFGNVVLRYVFNSGLTWSEEMSRYLFVWLTFMGAVGALKENQHLGMDAIVQKLPVVLKKVVYVVSSLLMLYILSLVFDGSKKLTLLNLESKAQAPATGLPLTFVYGTGVVVSILMAIIIIFNIYRVFVEKNAIEKLEKTQELGEEMPNLPTQTVAK